MSAFFSYFFCFYFFDTVTCRSHKTYYLKNCLRPIYFFRKNAILYVRFRNEGANTKMKQKDLKKLSRSELLEMLLDRSKEVEHLRKELSELKQNVASLEEELNNSGRINDVITKLETMVAKNEKE